MDPPHLEGTVSHPCRVGKPGFGACSQEWPSHQENVSSSSPWKSLNKEAGGKHGDRGCYRKQLEPWGQEERQQVQIHKAEGTKLMAVPRKQRYSELERLSWVDYWTQNPL